MNNGLVNSSLSANRVIYRQCGGLHVRRLARDSQDSISGGLSIRLQSESVRVLR